MTGLEPVRTLVRGILSPLRLPIPPQRLIVRKTPKNSAFFTCLEAPPGFEPGDKGFADLCLTTWLWRRITKDAECVFCVYGAEDEIRTRDVHLGKVTLYH